MDHVAHTLRHQVATGLFSLLLLTTVTSATLALENSATGVPEKGNSGAGLQSANTADASKGYPRCNRDNTVVADVVALEQVYFYNRFGAFNPGGMLYALRRDVVYSQDSEASQNDTLPLSDGEPIPAEHDHDAALAGNVRLRPDKRPRPIVLRVNEGDCLKVVFSNLLSPIRDGEEHVIDPETGREISIDSDEPATRSASMHVNGLDGYLGAGYTRAAVRSP